MSSLNWLHFCDLHCEKERFIDKWAAIELALREDLKKLSSACLPIDLILFTGDLVQSGDNEDNFVELQTT